MAKLLPALAVLFLATTKVVAITSGESNQRAPHHIIVRGDSSEPSSLLRTEQDAVLAHQADAAGKMQLDVSSSGHFIAPHHVKRRDGESGENSDQRSREILAAEGKTSAATALEIQQLPETLSSEIRVAVSVVAFLLAVVTVAFAIYTYFAKPLSREELQRRDEAATKVQKRVRGNAARNMLENQQKASSQEAAGGSLRDVLLEGDEINGRYRKLRPNASIEPENDERNYQTMVHTLTYEELAQVLNSKLNCSDNYRCMTEPAGLTEEQAGLYLNAHGRNKITPPAREDPWIKLVKLTFGGLFNALLWFCVGAQVILIRIKVKEHPSDTMAVDEFVTPIILTVVIVAAAFLQWYTEMQAENMMESVQGMQATQDIRVVRRDSHGNRLDLDLNPELLVPGDVIFLEAGVRIPADLRILHCTDGMEVDNSALTGESMPEARVACVEVGEAIMEARNVAFAATTVLKGNATCIVHSTGDLTFLGKIASGLKGPRTHSTLEIQIEHFVHIVALVAIGVGLLSIGANMLSPVQRSLSAILENSATALFAQVPEGLLPTVTISLMIASRQLSDRKVLVRKLDAVETLGCVNVICSDKTGTLTTGEMSAVTMVVPESGQEAGASRRVPDDLNPLERLTPRGGSAENLDISNRVAGVFDIATTQDWNFQCLCMCGLLNNAAQVSGGEPIGEVSLSLPGSREWTERWKATGSPTEVAILRAALENLGGLAGAMQFRAEFGLVHEVPFNSDNKWMLTIHTHPKAVSSSKQYQMILKGAPERVLDKCTLTTDERAEIEEYQSELMSKGLRVLCFATRSLSGDETGGRAPGVQQNFVDADPGGTGSAGDCNYPMDGFCFVGLVGIEDPPKRGVANAVIAAQAAGVKVVMVTGDHPETAKAIASRINIVPPAGLFGDAATFCAVPGSMLEDKMPVGANFSDEDPPQVTDFWQRAVTHTRVFARVSPIHKQVIVQAFQHFGNNRIGDICAMTGDGVNDAPALKQADVGVAMGVRGTEVAKDAADIILMDDNFSSIVDGIEQGRLASDNLQKSIMYTLCSKVPQVAPTFAEILGVPMALNAVQVLLIDIGTDIWTAIAFAMQPAEAALMQYAPRHPHFEKLVNWKVLVYSYCYIGQLQMLLCWIFYLMEPGIMNLVRKQETSFSHGERLVHHRGMTVYYWTLVLGQIAAAVSTTTKTQRIFGPGGYGLPNMSLNLLILLEVILGVAVMYEPNMNKIFNTAPLSMSQVLLPVLAIPIILSIDEVRKLIVRASMPLPLLPQQLSAEEVSSAHRRRSLPLPAPTAAAAPGAGTRTEGFASSRYRASVA